MNDTLPTFTFSGYTLRPAGKEDLVLAHEWTYADPHHAETTLPTFWTEQGIGINSFLLLNAAMRPVFFFKMVRKGRSAEIEVHIQFPPDSPETRIETIAGLVAGFTWLEKRLAGLGFKTLYFHSRSPRLITFCQRRLGFAWDGRRLERAIEKGTVQHVEANQQGTQQATV